jgi:hypothetical protein
MQHQISRQRMLSTRLIALSTIALCAHFGPTSLRAQDVPLARYGIVDELVLADSGEARLLKRSNVADLGLRDRAGPVSFIMVFVIDTTGKVEMPSASFGNDVPSDFVRAMCRILQGGEYEPVVREGRRRRALVVASLMMQSGDSQGRGFAPSGPLRTAIKANGIVASLPQFAKLPHCDY